jgi:hypothetical protein
MESSTTTSADIQNGSISVFQFTFTFAFQFEHICFLKFNKEKYLIARSHHFIFNLYFCLQAVESDSVPRATKADSKSTTRRPLSHDKRSGFLISKLLFPFTSPFSI